MSLKKVCIRSYYYVRRIGCVLDHNGDFLLIVADHQIVTIPSPLIRQGAHNRWASEFYR